MVSGVDLQKNWLKYLLSKTYMIPSWFWSSSIFFFSEKWMLGELSNDVVWAWTWEAVSLCLNSEAVEYKPLCASVFCLQNRKIIQVECLLLEMLVTETFQVSYVWGFWSIWVILGVRLVWIWNSSMFHMHCTWMRQILWCAICRYYDLKVAIFKT